MWNKSAKIRRYWLRLIGKKLTCPAALICCWNEHPLDLWGIVCPAALFNSLDIMKTGRKTSTRYYSAFLVRRETTVSQEWRLKEDPEFGYTSCLTWFTAISQQSLNAGGKDLSACVRVPSPASQGTVACCNVLRKFHLWNGLRMDFWTTLHLQGWSMWQRDTAA